MKTCGSRQDAQGAARQHQAGEDDLRLREQLQHIRHKLLVMSGKGGVGKTSVGLLHLVGGPNEGLGPGFGR